MFKKLVLLVTVLVAFVDCTVVLLDDSVTSEASLTPGVGQWTGWLDESQKRRFGDFENIRKYRTYYNQKSGQCLLWCDDPLAVEYRVKTMAKVDTALAELCVKLELEDITEGMYRGFNCYNHKQMTAQTCTGEQCQSAGMYDPEWGHPEKICNRCPQFEVRYFCPGTKPENGGGCKDVTRRLKQESRIYGEDLDVKIAQNRDLNIAQNRDLNELDAAKNRERFAKLRSMLRRQ